MCQLTMYCHWRPPDALLTWNGFGVPGHQRPNFDGFIYIHHAAPPYSLASAPFTSSRLAKFGWVLFTVCNAWQWSRTDNLPRVSENFGPIWTVCERKFTKISDIVGDPSHFPMPLSDCLCHVSFRRYSPLSVKIVERPNKCIRFFGPSYWGGTTLTFLRQIVSAM